MDTKTVGQWGAIGVSILTLLIFVAALVVALVFKNENMLLMLVGAAISMAQTAVGFWLGSSNSSKQKDDTIAQAVPVQPVVVPPRIIPP